MRRLAFVACLIIILGSSSRIGEPEASAISPTTSTTRAVAPLLPASMTYQTITETNPANVINVARIPIDAAVEIKAILAPRDSKGHFMALPSDIAKSLNALLVVNGDIHLYNGIPIGGIVTDGQPIRPTVTNHSQVSLDKANRPSYGENGEIPPGTFQSLGASYRLLRDGIQTSISEHTIFTESRQARTLMGWNAQTGEIIFVTVDKGRASSGMSLNEAASLMLRLGATDAANLDGGGSTQMVVDGELRNIPSSGPRPVSNFWVVLPDSASSTTPSPKLTPARDKPSLRGRLVYITRYIADYLEKFSVFTPLP